MVLVRWILGKFLGVVCHCFHQLLEVPTFAARCPTSATTREILAANGRTMGEKGCPVILPTWRLYSRHYGSFTCRKSTTWDRRLYFRSEGRRAEDFFSLCKRRLMCCHFRLVWNVQSGVGAQPNVLFNGYSGSFPSVKAAGDWSWPLT
jgi:hypothetical protein